MVDVTSGFTSAWLFNNQTTPPGTSANFGPVHAGDTLLFELMDQSTGGQVYSSDPTHSADGINHIYSTGWSGAVVNGQFVPPGTYIGAEDRPLGGSDLNYNDDSFVFLDVTQTEVPEPASLLMLATG